MLKIGLIGTGHLGKIHLKLIKELTDQFELVGIYDSSPTQLATVCEDFNCQGFSTPEELLQAVDCIDIVTPTIAHYELAALAIKQSKHVFIEKPITHTSQEARTLLALAKEAGVKVQVGHVERFNPAFTAALPYLNQPMFIEAHRLSIFNPRGTDVPVVLDLMIHDIDIILKVVNSPVRKISASGVAVVSETPDIANVRLEFNNGCVANLTASRISLKNMRKSRFFQKDAYISVNFLDKEMEIVQMEELQGEAGPFDMVLDMGIDKPAKKILFNKPQINEVNAIKEELKTFGDAINNDTTPIVTLEDGLYALEIAERILDSFRPVESNI
ncbi:MAG: Gfo/Idh/MocA family oxidoreductase [Brumimicrobium sp.]|nr:Gfo/Idh/MocA family oxidoreductase [Brumimicrobium sp.]MCO5268802.1 Gfo/Idh/MocA family oxidoreductase [Brumimicrobium sp.]